MADPRRGHLVDGLVAKLDVEPAVVWDAGDQCRTCTGVFALRAGLKRTDTTHHVVVQDDAVVCRDLAAGVAKLAEHVPDGSPIGLYYGTGPPAEAQHAALYRRANAAGHRWVAMRRPLLWGVAVALPTATLPDLIGYYRSLNSISYDGRVSAFYRRIAKVDGWYPIPSLVDHLDGESLVSRRRGERVAHEWIGADRSPLDIDWSTGVTR